MKAKDRGLKAPDKYKHFVRLRFGLKDHIKTGKMQGQDLGIYVALHLHADYQTGVVYHISAPYLATFLRESVHKVRRSLCRLEKSGYIKRFGHRGQVSGYDILIDRYLLLNCILTCAAKSLSLQEIAWTVTQPCKLMVSQNEVKCIPSAIQVRPIVDIIDIRVIDEKIDRGKKPPKKKYNPIDLELSQLLFKLICKKNPDSPEPNFDDWADEVRKLREIDKHTPEQIRAVIEWSQADDFWWDKVLSTASLRKRSKTDKVMRIDRIKIQMQKGKEDGTSKNRKHSEPTGAFYR